MSDEIHRSFHRSLFFLNYQQINYLRASPALVHRSFYRSFHRSFHRSLTGHFVAHFVDHFVAHFFSSTDSKLTV
ncbi:MAG: hypothetical protein GQF41_4298 [Candidatus Rifleibacterium amylolyticum]|nr:MAG: hypothetical protein GQF41_4298 [Candidatus Rifleibacterium amylolyticum]